MTFAYWIQKHDYSAEDTSDVTVEQAVAAYLEFDWRPELAAYDETDEGRNCPPGIGIHNGYDGSNPEAMLLHICPRDETTVFFNFHRRSQSRFLGLWQTSSEDTDYAERVASALVPDLIRALFAHDPTPILRHCE